MKTKNSLFTLVLGIYTIVVYAMTKCRTRTMTCAPGRKTSIYYTEPVSRNIKKYMFHKAPCEDVSIAIPFEVYEGDEMIFPGLKGPSELLLKGNGKLAWDDDTNLAFIEDLVKRVLEHGEDASLTPKKILDLIKAHVVSHPTDFDKLVSVYHQPFNPKAKVEKQEEPQGEFDF